MDTEFLQPLSRVLIIVILAGFMPLSAFSFYRFRLPRKEQEYSRIVKTLDLEENEASLWIPAIKNEYSAIDYAIPVGLVTFVCLLGATVVAVGEKIPVEQNPSLLFSTVCASGASLRDCQMHNLLVFSMAFLGGYVWAVQSIFRRLVTIDLPPAAYYGVCIRIILAAFVALVLNFLLQAIPSAGYSTKIIPALAFLTGIFPEQGLYYLKEKSKIFAEKATNRADDLPLEMIEGINIFHKIRLNEIGIDNSQNLAEANLLELLLRTPFKPRLLIDWIGQARLYILFKSDIAKLREIGIRTVIDLKTIGDMKGGLDELAQITNIPGAHLNLVYQIIKDDPGINKLVKAVNTLSVI